MRKMYGNKGIPDNGDRNYQEMEEQHAQRFQHYEQVPSNAVYGWNHQNEQQPPAHQEVVILQLDPNSGVQIPIQDQHGQHQFIPQHQVEEDNQVWSTELHHHQHIDQNLLKSKRPSECSLDEGYKSTNSIASAQSPNQRPQGDLTQLESGQHKDLIAQKVPGCQEQPQQVDPNSGNLMWLLDFKLDFFNDGTTLTHQNQDNQQNNGKHFLLTWKNLFLSASCFEMAVLYDYALEKSLMFDYLPHKWAWEFIKLPKNCIY